MNNIVDFVKKISFSIGQDLRVCMPGKVVKFDYNTQKAEVKIDMKEALDGDDEIDYPVISAVPVLFLRSGGASITAPVKRGDSCMLLFTDRDITTWLLGEGGGAPESKRNHALSDAIAIMGLSSFTAPAVMENNSDLLIKYDQSVIRLKPNGNIDIHSKASVNVETQIINAKCNDANIEAIGNVDVKCNDANIEAIDSIVTKSKYATIQTELVFNLECENANIRASNNVNVECKNSYLTTEESAFVVCKSAKVKADDNITLQSATTDIVASGNITLNSENLTISNASDVIINSKNMNITTQENININCKSASITATDEIITSSKTLNHTGDMTVSGKLDVSGQATFAGITFSSHKHGYNEAVQGSEPTVVVPGVTQGAQN